MGAAGRMGSTLVRLVREDGGMTLAGVVERPENLDKLAGLGCPATADLVEILPGAPGAVVIDFTQPQASMTTAGLAARHGNPAVIGTTGLKPDELAELERNAVSVPIFWSPNMSVGVNVLLRVLPALVRMLGPAYDLEMTEIHHNKKADAPSGTALKLAQVLAEAREWDLAEVGKYCREGIIGPRPTDEIGVQTIRGGDVVGDHTIYFLGPGERIEITHRLHSRDTLAQGALRAAAWLAAGAKPGKLLTMSDLLAATESGPA
jgi:4-hydroxy-tetrahydrodipicolinate reductase